MVDKSHLSLGMCWLLFMVLLHIVKKCCYSSTAVLWMQAYLACPTSSQTTCLAEANAKYHCGMTAPYARPGQAYSKS